MERHETRVLSAVIALDVVGYCRHMGRDEEATLRRLRDYRDLIEEIVRRHGGRVFGVAGDSEMAVVPDAGGALRSALEIQKSIEARNADLAEAHRMPLRLGINFGQVRIEGDGAYGDDVNIAARLENFAEAGEICISRAVFDRVLGSAMCDFDDFGPQRFKNIARPVRVYRVRAGRWARGQVRSVRRRQPRPERWARIAAWALIAMTAATAWGYHAYSERARVAAEADRSLDAAQMKVEAAEREVVRLMAELRAAEQRAAQERQRVEVLLVSLRAAREEVLARDSAAEVAAAWERRAENLMTELHQAEARVSDERARAEELLAALAEAERRAAAARRGVEPRAMPQSNRDTRNEARGRAEQLLATWTTLLRRAGAEEAQTAAPLTKLAATGTTGALASEPVSKEFAVPRPRGQPTETALNDTTWLPPPPPPKPVSPPSAGQAARVQLAALPQPAADVDSGRRPLSEGANRPANLRPEPSGSDAPGVERSMRTLQETSEFLTAHRDELEASLRAYRRETGHPKVFCRRSNISLGDKLHILDQTVVAAGLESAIVDIHYGNTLPGCNTVATGRFLVNISADAPMVVERVMRRAEAVTDEEDGLRRAVAEYLMKRRDELTELLKKSAAGIRYPIFGCRRTAAEPRGRSLIKGVTVLYAKEGDAVVELYYSNAASRCDGIATQRVRVRWGENGLSMVGLDKKEPESRPLHRTLSVVQAKIDSYIEKRGIDLARRLRVYQARTNFPRVGDERNVKYASMITRVLRVAVRDVQADTLIAEIMYQCGTRPNYEFAIEISRAVFELQWEGDDLSVVGHRTLE